MGGAGSTTIAATARKSIPRLTVPFPTQLDLVSVPPLLGERGTVLTGKWHLILDLSSPEGQSVNDSIPEPPFRVQYVAVDAFIDGTLG